MAKPFLITKAGYVEANVPNAPGVAISWCGLTFSRSGIGFNAIELMKNSKALNKWLHIVVKVRGDS